MEISKKSEASIALIVAAVIGLIILVVIIAMISGKLGAFGKGTNKVVTCDNACQSVGADGYESLLKENCIDNTEFKRKKLAGEFSDITLADNVCCCKWKK